MHLVENASAALLEVVRHERYRRCSAGAPRLARLRAWQSDVGSLAGEHQWQSSAVRGAGLYPDTWPALAAELPRNAAVLDKAGDAAAQLLLNHRPPRDQGELARFLHQRIFAADELHGLPIGAGDALAACRRVERQATLARGIDIAASSSCTAFSFLIGDAIVDVLIERGPTSAVQRNFRLVVAIAPRRARMPMRTPFRSVRGRLRFAK